MQTWGHGPPWQSGVPQIPSSSVQCVPGAQSPPEHVLPSLFVFAGGSGGSGGGSAGSGGGGTTAVGVGAVGLGPPATHVPTQTAGHG